MQEDEPHNLLAVLGMLTLPLHPPWLSPCAGVSPGLSPALSLGTIFLR